MSNIVHKPRLFYLDWIRAFSVILIVITHFNNPFLVNNPIFANSPFGIYIGGLGVSQFLIISGAALMYNYEDADHMNLCTFYWKRFKSIYPMFWIAFIVANTYLLILSGGGTADRAPKWRLIFSIIGMDGYIANAGISTFYTLGEWFLGFIVIFYFLFPLLRYGVNKHPWITAVIGLALYTLTLEIHPSLHGMPQDLLITTRLPELLFGMYFVRYLKKVPHLVAACSIILLGIQQFTNLLKGNIAVTVVGILFFLVLVWIGNYINIQPVRVITTSLSKYSYAIFLVHHQVIIQVFNAVNPERYSTGVLGAYVLFAADCLIILGLSIALERLNNSVLKYIQQMFKKNELPTTQLGAS